MCAPLATPALVFPPTVRSTHAAPTASPPPAAVPTSRLKSCSLVALTVIAPALSTVPPRVAALVLASLTTTTAAPTPATPPAAASACTSMRSSMRLETTIAPPDDSVPVDDAVALVLTLRMLMLAAMPTAPTPTAPPIMFVSRYSLARTCSLSPASTVAPLMIAEVPMTSGAAAIWFLMFKETPPIRLAFMLELTLLWALPILVELGPDCSLPMPLMLPTPLSRVSVLCACASSSTLLPLRSRALWSVRAPESLESAKFLSSFVPMFHTETAPARPTAPAAPLIVRLSTDLIAAALTAMSSLAFTRPLPTMLAAVLLFRLPTSTAPPMPTKPPAIASAKVCTVAWLLATTTTSCAEFAVALSLKLTSAAPMVALVSDESRSTVSEPDAPTKPPPPAIARWNRSSLERASTTTPLAAMVPKLPPAVVPSRTVNPVPLPSAVTSAPSAIRAVVCLSTTTTPTAAPIPT